MSILIELIILLIISIGTIISLSGLGQMLIFSFRSTLFESSFFGFLVLALIVTFVHFFFKITFIISAIILFVGFFWGLKTFIISKLNNKKEIFILSLIILILIPIYISQKYHEDFGYYHLPYIINVANEKIIFGLANVNRAFVHNSIWLNILPIFYLNENFNFVTIPTFLIYCLLIIFSIKNIFYEKNKNISNFF